MCPSAAAGVGAVCTQALMEPTFGPRGLALLREGLYPEDVRDMLIGADHGRTQRQLHIIDAHGRTAAHTGADCVEWCGHLSEPEVSVAGNMLAGPQVIGQTLAAYKANMSNPIVERLLAAMAAGEAAGGDKRGKQAAAILIQGDEPYPRLSIRVDDHVDPLAELHRLYDVAKERFIPFSCAFPRPERPYGITDRAFLETIIEREAGKPLGREITIPER
jgi:uncharacterized Ntn-hydrolase superfamily protein